MKKTRICDILNGYTTERNELLVMEINKLIKKTLCASCIYFTVISAVYMLILRIINVGDTAAVEADRILLFFLFSLLFSVANTIKSIKRINSALRNIAHYIICLFSFYACFMLPTNMRLSFVFTGLVIFTVAYLIVVSSIAIFKSRLNSNKEKSLSYSNQFKKKK